MRPSAVLLSAAAAVAVATAEPAFERYLQRFGKAYAGDEYASRLALYKQRAAQIEAINARPGRLWTAGMNEFTDMPREEFLQRLGHDRRLGRAAAAAASQAPLQASAAPPDYANRSVDWRELGPSVVTAVKDQGSCGSCWAFSAAETMESHLALQTGVLMSLSPQQLLSCTANPQHCGGGGGCSGATAQLAFNYTMHAGITDIWTYPYLSGVSQGTHACLGSSFPVAGITGFHTLPTNDAASLLRAVTDIGPVSVSVDAGDWHLYSSGIFDGCNKTAPIINHAVVLVGYGEANGTKYWLIRNSWGTRFGEYGYIRLRRYGTEPCGMDPLPEVGFGCDAGPPKVEVCGECGVLSDSSYPTGAFLQRPRRLRAPGQGAEAASAAARDVTV